MRIFSVQQTMIHTCYLEINDKEFQGLMMMDAYVLGFVSVITVFGMIAISMMFMLSVETDTAPYESNEPSST